MSHNISSQMGTWFASGDPLSTLDLSPQKLEYPFYFKQSVSILPWISDKYLSLLLPIVCYWGFSLFYQILDIVQLPFFEKYRLHEPAEVLSRNRVSKKRVVAMVVLQQFIQTILGMCVLEDDETVYKQVFTDHRAHMRTIGVYLARAVVKVAGMKSGIKLLDAYGTPTTEFLYWWGLPALQFFWAFLVMDGWQYFWHRAFHESRFLYRNFHSHHHRLYVPYAFGALYNHPLEGLVLDSLGAALAHSMALMTVRQAIVLFAFSTLKTVDDHGGYAFPWWLDPLHLVFPNTAEYHDVHHQMQGLRYNYSQPFFIHFDILFGTRMSVEKFRKMKEAKASKSQQAMKENGHAVTQSDEKSTTTALQNGSAAPHAELRKRDAAPKDIVSNSTDPFVTTDTADYEQKAGIATS